MAESSLRVVPMAGVRLSPARTWSCAMSVGQSFLTSTRHVAILVQMMNKLFGRLVEPLAVKLCLLRLVMPVSLSMKSIFQ